MSYKYYSDDTCSEDETENAPINAGVYYVKATVSEAENYKIGNSECTQYVMKKATPIVSLTEKSEKYTGSAISANTATVVLQNNETYTGNITYTYYTNNTCTEGATENAPVVAGKYYVKATTVSFGNYDSGDSGCVSHQITAMDKTISLTAKTETERTYTGKSITANKAVVTPDEGETITYTYYTNNTCTSGATTQAPTNVGTYYVKASVGTVNSSCVNHSIVKSNTMTELDDISKQYTGSAQVASGASSRLVSDNSTISNGSYTYTYYTNNTCTSGATTQAPTNVGTYYVKATLAGTSNYNSSISGCKTLSISNTVAELTVEKENVIHIMVME